jgi:hypothetical protein
MYANVRGLGDVLVRTGVIEELGVFEDFVRGFTRGKSLFDFVDVGAGKDRADKKIIGKPPNSGEGRGGRRRPRSRCHPSSSH